MEFLVRPARLEDREVLHSMLCELEDELLDKQKFDDVFLRNMENPDVGYFIAESQGTPLGMISCHVQLLLHHASAVAEIQEMYVDPSHRSHGVGRQLVDAVKGFARARGATQLEVTTNRIRIRTHHFYEREGFLNTHSKLVVKEISKKKDASK